MKTKKNTIRLTESELKKVITESVKRVLREANVYPGINKTSNEYMSADEWDTYTSRENGNDTVNDMIPDFVYTLAQRLEKQLLNVILKTFPFIDSNSEITVSASMDTNNSNYDSLKTSIKTTKRQIKFDIYFYDLYKDGTSLNMRSDLRLSNKIKSLIIKYSTMILGNLENCDITIGENSDYYIEIIANFLDSETWRDSGRYYGFEKTSDGKSSLFKNNPPRQIPGRRKIRTSYDDID